MRLLRTFFVLGAVLLVTGCNSVSVRNPGVALQNTPPSELPSYNIGDMFVFDDGYIERVIGVADDSVEWEAANGHLQYRSHRGFFIPRLGWETEKSKGVGYVSRGTDLNALWPLTPGSDQRFVSYYQVTDKQAGSVKPVDVVWRCDVLSAERIEVSAGVFDTIPVECGRYSSSSNKQWQTRIWYFAPSVGHYVRVVDELQAATLRPYRVIQRDLALYVPALSGVSAIEREQLEFHFQNALETLTSGSASEWTNDTETVGQTISLTRSFVTTDNKFCREFSMSFKEHGSSRQFDATACKTSNAWRYAVARGKLAGLHPSIQGAN